MYRLLTARKVSALNEGAIDQNGSACAFPLHRADPDPTVARRQALCFFANYTIVWLPAHCGICWLASYSLGLAAFIVLILAGLAFALALAKWLGLEDVLQRLPILLGVGLVFVVAVYLTSQPIFSGWLGSAESFGTFLILMAAVSIFGNFYRPMAAAYRTVTLKIPYRDLCVIGCAMLASLGLATLGGILPSFGFVFLTCVVVSGYAGLVVLEYASWARANPNVSLQKAMAFAKHAALPGKRASAPKTNRECSEADEDSNGTIRGAVLIGLGYGTLTVLKRQISAPSSEFCRLLMAFTDDDPKNISQLVGAMAVLGLCALLFGFCKVARSLKAFTFVNPLAGFPLVANALVVFLAYPGSEHPAVYKFQKQWLRPLSVRVAMSALVLITVATTLFSPSGKLPSIGPKAVEAQISQAPAVTLNPYGFRPGHTEIPRVPALPQSDPIARPSGATAQVQAPLSQVESSPSDHGGGQFLATAVILAVGPPVFIYLMIWFVGLTVLPTYFNYFEQPEPSATSTKA